MLALTSTESVWCRLDGHLCLLPSMNSPTEVLEEWSRSSSRKKLPRWSMSAKNCHQVMEYGKNALNIVATEESRSLGHVSRAGGALL